MVGYFFNKPAVRLTSEGTVQTKISLSLRFLTFDENPLLAKRASLDCIDLLPTFFSTFEPASKPRVHEHLDRYKYVVSIGTEICAVVHSTHSERACMQCAPTHPPTHTHTRREHARMHARLQSTQARMYTEHGRRQSMRAHTHVRRYTAVLSIGQNRPKLHQAWGMIGHNINIQQYSKGR